MTAHPIERVRYQIDEIFSTHHRVVEAFCLY